MGKVLPLNECSHTLSLETVKNELHRLLREGKIVDFNAARKKVKAIDLSSCDFRHLDLRGIETAGVDFRNSYFRQTDLRGNDFRKSLLEGASFHEARISGCLFPNELSSDEIRLSIEYGTRVRYYKKT